MPAPSIEGDVRTLAEVVSDFRATRRAEELGLEKGLAIIRRRGRYTDAATALRLLCAVLPLADAMAALYGSEEPGT